MLLGIATDAEKFRRCALLAGDSNKRDRLYSDGRWKGRDGGGVSSQRTEPLANGDDAVMIEIGFTAQS